MASVAQAAIKLHSTLSKDAQVLTDIDSGEFRESMNRWSDTDVKIPAAIFKPACEDDVLKIVLSLSLHIPFPKSLPSPRSSMPLPTTSPSSPSLAVTAPGPLSALMAGLSTSFFLMGYE